MTEQLKSGNFSAHQQTGSDVLVLIKMMQQQLTFLERKIDILISQSQEKPFSEKSFSKPFRSFNRPYRSDNYRGRRGQGEDFQERNLRPGRHSVKPEGDEHRGFGGKKIRFGPKKKFSFHKRKEQ